MQVLSEDERNAKMDHWTAFLGSRTGAIDLTVKSASGLKPYYLSPVPTVDSYCVVQFGEDEWASDIMPKECDPKWDFNVHFPVDQDTTPIMITVMDSQALGPSWVMGITALDLRSANNKVKRWVDDFGVYTERGRCIIDLLDENGNKPHSDLGSVYVEWTLEIRDQLETVFCDNCGNLDFKCSCSNEEREAVRADAAAALALQMAAEKKVRQEREHKEHAAKMKIEAEKKAQEEAAEAARKAQEEKEAKEKAAAEAAAKKKADAEKADAAKKAEAAAAAATAAAAAAAAAEDDTPLATEDTATGSGTKKGNKKNRKNKNKKAQAAEDEEPAAAGAAAAAAAVAAVAGDTNGAAADKPAQNGDAKEPEEGATAEPAVTAEESRAEVVAEAVKAAAQKKQRAHPEPIRHPDAPKEPAPETKADAEGEPATTRQYTRRPDDDEPELVHRSNTSVVTAVKRAEAEEGRNTPKKPSKTKHKSCCVVM